MQTTLKPSQGIALLIAGILFAFAASASAQSFPEYKKNNEWNPTPMEIVRLPPYCQGQFRPEMAHMWEAVLPKCGAGFNHYCPNLVALNRSANMSGSRQDRAFVASIAARGLTEMRQIMVPTCPIRQEVIAAEQLAQMRVRSLSRMTP